MSNLEKKIDSICISPYIMKQIGIYREQRSDKYMWQMQDSG